MNDINLPVPFFSQREILYKWQNSITNDSFYIAPVACNITSLCMLLNYLKITNDTPDKLADEVFSKNSEWNRTPTGYDNLKFWKYIADIPERIYGCENRYIKDLTGKNIDDSIIRYLRNGYPIIFSIGTTAKNGQGTTGHIVVLRGIKNDKYYIINDPWGNPANSSGLLNSQHKKIRGFYVARAENSDILFGKGNGDNCILQKEAFSNATGKGQTDKRLFNGAMTIVYPYMYYSPLGNFTYELDTEISKKFYNQFHEKYLLTENGKGINGIEIKNRPKENVYSIAAGRIVAVRNSTDERKNFILIQYRIPGTDNGYFYVNYKRLQYINIAEEIKK